MPFAVRLNLSIIGLLLIVFLIIFFCMVKFFYPMIKVQIENQALDTIGDIQKELLINIKRAESAAKILNTYAEEDLSDDDKEINIKKMPYISRNVLNILDPQHDLFHGAFVYVAPLDGRKEAMHQFFVQKNGKIRTDTTTDIEIYRSREWLKSMSLRHPLWTEPYIADDEKEKPVLITYTYPIFLKSNKDHISGQETPHGIVGIALKLENVQKMFRSIDFLKHGKALLISRQGTYICHPDEKMEMNLTVWELSKQPGLAPLAKMAENLYEGKSGSIRMERSTVVPGSSVFIFYGTQPDTGWGISLVFSQSELFDTLNNINYKILSALLFIFILMIFLVNILCKQLAKSLEKLSEVAQEYGTGNFDTKFPNIYGSDEIGRLADAFRNMRDNIVRYIAKEKINYAFEQKLANDMAIAGQIQDASLEKDFPSDKRFEVFALMDPSREVGGDFYDCFYLTDDKYAILIADVSGKGIPAALFMMMSRILIKTIAKSGLPISGVFSEANKALCAKNSAGMFVTAFLATVDLNTGEMEYVNAGHNPPLIRTQKGYDFFKPIKNIPLGYIEGYKYRSGKISLACGDRIFLYTDGITEAQNESGEFYGNERLRSALNSLPEKCHAKDTLDSVNASVSRFAGNAQQADDITMLELAYHPDIETAGSRSGEIFEKRNFTARIESWENISVFIEGKAEKAGLSQPKTMKVLISAEEIFSNIARYAYKEPGNADITVYVSGGMFNVLFEDTGIPYNPLEKDDPDITLSAEERQIGGLGIFIVKKSMDIAEYERKDGKNIFDMGIKIV